MARLQVHQFLCRSDNYGYLIHDSASELTAAIDTPAVEPVNEILEEKGWRLNHILKTHWHDDHAGGNLRLKEKWQCNIVGAATDAERIPGIDTELVDGDIFEFGEHSARVLEVSGHTIGHLAFHFADDNILFSGDALFALGCGRIFEGTAEQMWASLEKLMALPEQTEVYCGHEYTEANAAFALSVEPQNEALQQRAKEIQILRADGKPTVPSTIAIEQATNPFLRPSSRDLQENLGMSGGELVDVFAETRRRKDSF